MKKLVLLVDVAKVVGWYTQATGIDGMLIGDGSSYDARVLTTMLTEFASHSSARLSDALTIEVWPYHKGDSDTKSFGRGGHTNPGTVAQVTLTGTDPNVDELARKLSQSFG